MTPYTPLNIPNIHNIDLNGRCMVSWGLISGEQDKGENICKHHEYCLHMQNLYFNLEPKPKMDQDWHLKIALIHII